MWEPNVHSIWGTVGTGGRRDFDTWVCSEHRGWGWSFVLLRDGSKGGQSWERGGNPGRSHLLEGDCECYKSPLKFWQDSNPLLHSSSYFNHYFSTFLLEILSLFSQTFPFIGAVSQTLPDTFLSQKPMETLPQIPFGTSTHPVTPGHLTLHETSRRGRSTRCLYFS